MLKLNVHGPTVEYCDSDKRWYLNGNRHREDGPAIECTNGSKEWYLNGNRHRVDAGKPGCSASLHLVLQLNGTMVINIGT